MGTPERIQQVLTQAKFNQIEIHPRQMGTYLSLEKAQSRWNGQFWLHIDNPLRQLKPEKIRLLKASYDDEIAALGTGIARDDATVSDVRETPAFSAITKHPCDVWIQSTPQLLLRPDIVSLGC